MTTVLIVDDHALVRSGLRALIAGFNGFSVVGEAADGREALQLARRLAPDIMLLDIAMPGLNGLDTLARLRGEAPHCRALVVSMHSGRAYVEAALRAGARGYLEKAAAPAVLEEALRRVAAGGLHVPAPMRDLPALIAAGQGGAAESAGPALTTRQREILQLIAEGLATREIAARLSISIKTVETHRAHLMQRLDIHDVAGLTRHAIRIGLVSAD